MLMFTKTMLTSVLCRVNTSRNIKLFKNGINYYHSIHNLKLFTPKSTFLQTLSINKDLQVRNYAKGRDKKKEKNKKPAKVDISPEELSEVLNIDAVTSQMQKCVDVLKDEYIKNLSLRSTTGAIETINVIFEGKEYELLELAQITRKNPKTIIINMVSFPQAIPDVLTAIQKSGMNLNPQQDGTTLYIPVPKVTKEHRENLSKNAKTLFIKCRDSIKDVQNNSIRKVKKQDISSDLAHNIQDHVVNIADKYISEGQKILDSKQAELLGKD